MPHIKGTSLVPIVKWLRKNRTAAAPLLPEALHRYFSERVLPSSWYPEEDYKVLLLALGRLIEPHVPGDVWEFLGAEGARADLGGVHASLVREGDAWGTLKRSPKIWSIYHDSGRLECEQVAPEEARLSLHDYRIACPEVCATIAGYVRQMLVMAGANVFEARVLDCPPPETGPTLFRVRFES